MQDLVGRARALLGRLRAEVAQAAAAAQAAAKAAAIETAEEALLQSAVRESAPRSRPRPSGEAAEASSPPSSARADEASASSGSATCVVCLSAPKTTVMLPCKHVVSCAECTKALLGGAEAAGQPPQCPLCRTRIVDTLDVYI